jgi:PAS domain S-box-containing protein
MDQYADQCVTSDSAARSKSLFETLPIGVVFQDAEGRITEANPAALRILGLTLEQLQGRTSVDPRWRAVHADGSDFPCEEHPAMVCIRTGEPVHDVVMGAYNPLTGEQRWIRVNATPLFSPGESVPREVYATFEDFTELHLAELALRESEARLRATLDTMQIGCQILDSEWRYVYINPAAERHNRRPSAELIGNRYADMWPGIERTEVHGIIETCMRERTVQTMLNEFAYPDGAVGWFELIVQPMGGDVLIQSIDVTARVAADRALRESETRYRIVADNTYDWEWWVDPDGDFVYCSPGCAEITGYGPEEFMDDSGRLLEIVHPDDREKVRAHMSTYLSEPDATVIEFRVLAKDGLERIIDHRCRPVFADDGTWLGRHASNRDVTERRKAEEEVRRLNKELQRRVVSRTEQLDAATHELEALAYSIAHDVRAPLRTIDGFSAAVLEDEGEAMSEDARLSLQRVRTAAQTLARLLDDLTGLSRASQRELARERVDLSGLAEDVADEITLEHPSRRVELSVSPGLVADADPVLARVILRELLGNAWKFTARREVAHVEVGARDLEDAVAFYVRDDGAGFDLRYAEHLFGVFQRMHPPGEFEGDGVGLAMVQRLVRRHGGRCWAEAEVGKGATFFFTLPDEADADAGGERTAPASPLDG